MLRVTDTGIFGRRIAMRVPGKAADPISHPIDRIESRGLRAVGPKSGSAAGRVLTYHFAP